MRYIICFLLMLPLFAAAQDCALKKGQDAITSKPTLTTGFIDLQGNTLSIDISSKEIDFFFVLNGAAVKCLDEETELTVVYEGGKLKQQFKNYGSMNCDGIFHLIFKNSAYTNSQLQRMTAKKIVSIQFTSGTQKPFIISLLPDQQVSLQNTIACVIKESKTVL
ncbi:MAG TPA: hypothetical protein VL307_10535 [Chitinophagaceae bacterium]|nr:hypothetical protein [Chitinophagaceae bacterium]